jgi:uncharacterized protein
VDLKRKLDRLGNPGPARAQVQTAAPTPAPSPAPAVPREAGGIRQQRVATPAPPSAPASPPQDADRAERVEKLRRMLGALTARHAASGRPERAEAFAATPDAGLAQRARGSGDPAEAPAALVEREDSRAPAGSPSSPGKRVGPAEPRMTAHGLLHVAERLLPPGHRHGRIEVGRAASVEASLVAALALDPALAAVDFRRMLLLDTETTGLSGGAGTLPFLIGLGWFEGDALRLHQLFLRRPGEEGPMLGALSERLGNASCLVTYNGKTFDWPLLRTRFVLNRLPPPSPLPHLDLLHCARRVFRYRAGGARLVHIEESAIGHRRTGDIDGALIPEVYFRFLRTGDGRALARVVEHNAFDLTLLAALLATLVDGFRAGAARGDPRDHLGFADVAARAQDYDRALAFARAAAKAGEGDVLVQALVLTAQLTRRAGDATAAAESLAQALHHAGPADAASIHLALAKLCEHALRDLSRALRHARHTSPAEGSPANRRRVTRLEARIARTREC